MRNFAASYIKDRQINTYGKAIYQFGVYSGNSISEMIIAWRTNGLPKPYRIYGLDSFVGLPSSEGPWTKGDFNSLEYFGVDNVATAMYRVDKYINFANLRLIHGIWDLVLNRSYIEDVIHETLIQACYIDMDCDLYESAYCALDFMFKNRLVAPACIIGYDDWSGTVPLKEGDAGESKAHYEICEKYKVKVKEIGRLGKPPYTQPIFLVENYEGLH